MSDADEEALMDRARSGDRDAFGILVHRHVDSLYRYALRLSASAAAAEDLVQDTWLAAWQNANRYQADKAGLATWLHRILHNKYIDTVRKRQPAFDSTVAETVSTAELSSAEFIDPRLASRLDALISDLPQNQKAALTLAHLQGFSNRQVAHILGLSVRATESILARARRTLREQLSE